MAATTAGSEVSDGAVLSVINKRLRALRKKLNRITQMEESIAQGKSLNKEQEEVFLTKPSVTAAIDELDKLRQPLSAALSEEIDLAIQCNNQVETKTLTQEQKTSDGEIEDLLNLLYFGSMFDVKSQSDFTSTTLTRTHERECCLSYDYVSDDDAIPPLVERDLDLISMVGNLLISRPVDASLSHKNALQKCVEHAKLWLSNSDKLIGPDSTVTYSGLREKLAKIMASSYCTTSPEMKAPVEVVAAAAAGNYRSFQAQGEGLDVHYQLKEEELTNYEGNESLSDQPSLVEESDKGEYEVKSSAKVPPDQSESLNAQAEGEQNSKEVELKDQQNIPRRRGGRGAGGWRGYSNGRGGRNGGSRGGGVYQNGRSQYYDQPGNYYPRNNYRGRGGGGMRGGGAGGNSYDKHHGSVVPADS